MPARAILFVGIVLGAGLSAGGSRADPASDDLERLRLEIKRLQELQAETNKKLAEQQKEALAERDRKIVQQQKEMQELRARLVAAEIQAASLKQRNEQLAAELERMARDLKKLQQEKPAARPPTQCPPADQVEGLVKKVTAERLVVISIGADAGLARGHTLEVFRLGKEPAAARYLGTVRVVEVKASEAVAQVVGKSQGEIKAGDRVASKR